MKKEDMAEALVDVRKAHRLLALFYERVDSYISIVTRALGFNRYWLDSDLGPTTGSHNVRGYAERIARHGSQYLPLASTYYLFLRPTREPEAYHGKDGHSNLMFPGDAMLAIKTVADSGLRTNLQGNPWEAETYFLINLIANTVEMRRNWKDAVFLPIKRQLEELSRLRNGSWSAQQLNVQGVEVHGEKWPLELLPDEEALWGRIEDFSNKVRDKLGIELRPSRESSA